MKKKNRKEAELDSLSTLSKKQKAELKASEKALLKSSGDNSDRKIDPSSIAPLDDEFLKTAARNPFYKPTKTSTTVRLDSDVLAWLKSQGKGYQTRMNNILREAMLNSL